MSIQIFGQNFIFNPAAILNLGDRPFFSLLWYLIAHGGWVLFVFLAIWAISTYIRYQNETVKEKNAKYILLSIDVPRDNPHGPEVTERLFANLATAGTDKGLKFSGSLFMQPRFSFEIISIGGRIQFLVRAPEEYHELVEAAFYGEYPNAEISEIPDYITEIPNRYPNFEYDIWGSEIILYNKDAYPIRTYPAFEHSLSGEFKDPISNLLEVLSKLREGEQFWIQLVITFGGLGWKKKGEALVNSLIGKRGEKSEGGGFSGFVSGGVHKLLGGVANFIYEGVFGEPVGGSEKGFSAKEPPPSLITFLSPGEREIVSEIQKKISKIGFRTKFRIMYVAKKDIFDFHRAIPGVLGALNQFNTLDMNGLRPDDHIKTKASKYSLRPTSELRKKKNELMLAYKERSLRRGTNGFILNIEELATIYHFPILTVEAPLVKKTGSKKGEPPFALPTKEEF